MSALAHDLTMLRSTGVRGVVTSFFIITLTAGVFGFLLMPPGPCQTASWFRGKKDSLLAPQNPADVPSFPNLSRFVAHPIQVGWNSRNSNTVRSRTVSAACYNMFVQASGIISSNIYRQAPLYRRGNRYLLAIAIGDIALYVLVKAYYVARNHSRDRKWDAMTEDERLKYLQCYHDGRGEQEA
ncbi:hypothetical protein SODALDRAFT_374550 [Sodiomyces alkalinus F11]|uniref:Uncharacterized protein n=1 Tax=Sodiomyces alkalinus (strain CBS 110278 / VKM F-3762 / F11) TaxID=1314773 RepID=A0A3N2Q628_SODAK|nr:hypothetical protein SODALDRAFT_374550 [Sodiomyces alkalinus F11]ROT42190.1 hypothetical protein SODALDRAFT_374550 [Sodiomyces alkalinus F11]